MASVKCPKIYRLSKNLAKKQGLNGNRLADFSIPGKKWPGIERIDSENPTGHSNLVDIGNAVDSALLLKKQKLKLLCTSQ